MTQNRRIKRATVRAERAWQHTQRIYMIDQISERQVLAWRQRYGAKLIYLRRERQTRLLAFEARKAFNALQTELIAHHLEG